MKKTSALIAAAASLSLVATPVLAQAERASQPTEESEQLFGGNIFITAALVAAVIVAIVLISDDDDEPVSP